MKRVLTFCFMLLCSGAICAQSYPSRPIKVIVPYAPGGTTDVVARQVGERLAKKLNQAVIIDNKAGGNTNIGTQEATRSAPE